MRWLDWLMNLLRPPQPPPAPPPEPPLPPNTSSLAGQLLAAHNRERQQRGAAPLAINSRLTQSAQRHAEWMALHGRLHHQPLTGYLAAENIAVGHLTVTQVMTGWMTSPGHRRNILGSYREAGFGVALDREGQRWWCVVFAR